MGTTTPISEAKRSVARRASLSDALSSEQLRKRAVARMRYALTNLLEENGERVQEWLNTIAEVDGPKAALDMYLRLLEFGVPKLSRAEVSVESEGKTHKADLTMDELQQIIREYRTIEGVATDASLRDLVED